MLMLVSREGSRRDHAYARLDREYPTAVLMIETCFSVCSGIPHAISGYPTGRVLDNLDCDRQRDVGFTRADLRNGRLDIALSKQYAAAGASGTWAGVWSWLVNFDKFIRALAELGADCLRDLREQGLKARRERLNPGRTGGPP